MKKLCLISFLCLTWWISKAQTVSPDAPKLLPDTSSSLDQNKSGALYRSPNDSLQRPSASTTKSDTAHYGNAGIKDSLFKEPRTVRYKEQTRHVKYSANKKVKSSMRQNSSTKKKGVTQ